MLYRLHQQTERRMDERFGLLASLYYNSHRGNRKERKPGDWFGHSDEPQTTTDHLRVFEQWAASCPGIKVNVINDPSGTRN